ncbi:MAG: redoxin family protein [Sphingomicrobium sp.]
MSRKVILFAPLAMLFAFSVVAVWRLANPPETAIRSRLEGKAVAAFALPAAVRGRGGLSSGDLAAGKPKLLNIFASWCVPCLAEAPVLLDLKLRGVTIEAIAVRDREADVADFLVRNGDPFDRIGSDRDSRAQMALGSSGVPESFVIDGQGVIRYQHVGPIEPEDVATILAEMEKAR